MTEMLLGFLLNNNAVLLVVIPFIVNMLIKRAGGKSKNVIVEIGQALEATINALKDGKIDKPEAEKIIREYKDVLDVFKADKSTGIVK